jgi:uncharacterized protein
LKLLVDADACPKPVKEIIYRVAKRLQMTTIFYANQGLYLPPSPYLKLVVVPPGFDVADQKIVEEVEAGDLVITADVPLAAGVIEKKAFALNPRGEFYSEENMRQLLQIRNVAQERRDAGERLRGPAPLKPQDHQAFANALDRFLARK